MHEGYLNKLISHDLLFSDKKHQLEMENLMKIQDRDRIIWATLCGIFALTILVGWLYYRAYRSKTRRILAEKENENLKLEQDNLRKEKEKENLNVTRKHLKPRIWRKTRNDLRPNNVSMNWKQPISD